MRATISRALPVGLSTEHFPEINLDEIRDHLINGCLLQPLCKSQSDAKLKFDSADFLALAIDTNVLPVERIRNAAFTQSFATLFCYPAPGAASSRAVLVFLLPDVIVEAKAYALLLAGIETMYAGSIKHRTAIDPTVAVGLTKCDEIRRGLTTEVLRELKSLGAETKLLSTGNGGAIRSKVPLSLNTLVTVDEQSAVQSVIAVSFDTVGEGVEVFCPVHVDSKKTARTVLTQTGRLAIVCHHCKRSYLSPHTPSAEDTTDQFENFITRLEGYASGVASARSSITFSNERYLRGLVASEGVLCVKSPKGSGKTEQLVDIVAEARRQGKPVLLVGHRRSLLQSMAARLGIDCYFASEQDVLDKAFGRPEGSTKTELLEFDTPVVRADDLRRLAGLKETTDHEAVKVAPTGYFAVCMDSIKQVSAPNALYNLVIIDESEQVFAHLVGETVKFQRREVFRTLRTLLQRAESIILLDADFSLVSMRALFSMGLKGDLPVRLHINRYVPPLRSIRSYASKGELTKRLRDAFVDGDKIFVATNSKNKAQELAAALTEIDDTKKIVCIHSDNSSSTEIQSILKNICNQFEHHIDVLIASPSLGTGVDITFKDDTGKDRVVVQHVFGLFIGEVTTHTDCDQHLSRVRMPGNIHVWIDPMQHHFETDAYLLLEQHGRLVSETESVVGYNDGDSSNEIDDDLMRIWAENLAFRNDSINKLAERFWSLRKLNGWSVDLVAADKEEAKDGDLILEIGREQRLRAREKSIVEALPFTESDADQRELAALEEKAKKGSALSQEDKARLERQRIERFYEEAVSPDLVQWDAEGRMRRCILNLALMLCPRGRVLELDLGDCNFKLIDFDRALSMQRRKLIRDLLGTSKLFKRGQFDCEVALSSSDLPGFAKKAVASAVELERLFGVTVRKDCVAKPILQLQEILKLVGLNLEASATRDIKGAKVRFYKLDSAAVTSIMPCALRKIEPWQKKQREMLQRELEESSDQHAD